MDMEAQINYTDVFQYYPDFNIDSEDSEYIKRHLVSTVILKTYDEVSTFKGNQCLRGRLLNTIGKRTSKSGEKTNLKRTDILLPKYCQISGQEINYYDTFNHSKSPKIILIDADKGHVKGNIKIVCKNAAKFKILVQNSKVDHPYKVTFTKNRFSSSKSYDDIPSGDIVVQRTHGKIGHDTQMDVERLTNNIQDRKARKKVSMFVMIERLTNQIPQTIERLQELGELTHEVVTELYHKLN